MSDTATVHILLAVDESEVTRRAVGYVARLLAGRSDGRVLLLHVLPPLPPARAHPPGAAWLPAQAIEAETRRWQSEAEESARPLLETVRGLLARSVADQGCISSRCVSVPLGSDLAETILAAAVEAGCDTIVVGRESFSRFRELLRGHVSDELVRKTRGRTLWIVE